MNQADWNDQGLGEILEGAKEREMWKALKHCEVYAGKGVGIWFSGKIGDPLLFNEGGRGKIQIHDYHSHFSMKEG